MTAYAPPVQRLITELSKLPGVGGRTAQRLAFHLLRASEEDALSLAEAIKDVKQRIGLCTTCFNLAEGPTCRICADARRDPTLICAVEEPSDVISIERTHEFSGRYHVLGGALSPIDGIDPEDLRIAELYQRAADGRTPGATRGCPPTSRRRSGAPPAGEGPPGGAGGGAPPDGGGGPGRAEGGGRAAARGTAGLTGARGAPIDSPGGQGIVLP